jgi:hypothetical protein
MVGSNCSQLAVPCFLALHAISSDQVLMTHQQPIKASLLLFSAFLQNGSPDHHHISVLADLAAILMHISNMLAIGEAGTFSAKGAFMLISCLTMNAAARGQITSFSTRTAGQKGGNTQ